MAFERCRARRRAWLALTAIAVLAATFASTADARAPVLTSVTQAKGRITADWELPPGVEAEEVEASRKPNLDGAGGFSNPVAYGSLDSAQTHWRSRMLGPGLYYVHVSGSDFSCDECPGTEWSNVLSVQVLPVPPKPGTYRGPAGYFGANISFVLTKDLARVKKLTATYELDCRYGTLPRKIVFKPIPVEDGKFKVKARGEGPAGAESISIRGTFDPPNHAFGRLRATASYRGIGKCRLFSAGRKGLYWRAKQR